MYNYMRAVPSPTDLVQSTYGAVLEQETLEYGVWPPRMVVDTYVWWCKNFDTLLGHNPVWYVRTKGPFFSILW